MDPPLNPKIDHPLLGSVLKLDRAEEHLHALKGAIEGFLERNFYSLSTELDRQQRLVICVGDIEPIPPQLSVLMGECIYNFHSALDHLAYELAVLHTGEPLPESIATSSAFPIFDSGPEFRATKKNGQPAPKSGLYKIRGVSPRAGTAIERLQPYHRRKNPAAKALWQLQELSRIDKHRRLHLTVAALTGSRFRLRGFDRVGAVQVFPRALKEKAIIARIEAAASSYDDVQVETDLTLDVLFDKDSPSRSLRRERVIRTLYNISDYIGEQVVPTLSPFFPGSIERVEEP